ncbi:polyprenyl synthetase family protein [Arcanobacterium ihumii]|uniref:polyprenyl synthetase family protein n=1 Tax=Arcanobacterium ihumii TaxID=2138162 RepID=UPI000F5410C8|nr:polyprenyl synthetase family protein [Arcanobacterium ihumii]
MHINLDDYRAAVTNSMLSALGTPLWSVSDQIQSSFEEFLEPLDSFIRSGKRTRALLMTAGWESCLPGNAMQLPVNAGAALELYQASALVHDDIVDNAVSRRGVDAVHVAFSKIHQNKNLISDRSQFGVTSALLLGDYLLSLSARTFEDAESVSESAHNRARSAFHSMTAEVAYGQFLDNRAEYTPLTEDAESIISHAQAVLVHKSARYSVELPLIIGATLAGAEASKLDVLHKIGRPLGEAFQLRDDLLGVFGDPEITGKPSGGDLSEGKRTVLLGMTLKLSTQTQRRFLCSRIGQDLNEAEIDSIRSIIHETGALDEYISLIENRENQALNEFENSGISGNMLPLMFEKLAARTH